MFDRIVKACSTGLAISLLILVILAFVINEFSPELFETKYPMWVEIDIIIIVLGTLIIPVIWLIATKVLKTDDYLSSVRKHNFKKHFNFGKLEKWVENPANVRKLIKYSTQVDNIFNIDKSIDADLIDHNTVEEIFEKNIEPSIHNWV